MLIRNVDFAVMNKVGGDAFSSTAFRDSFAGLSCDISLPFLRTIERSTSAPPLRSFVGVINELKS